MGARAELAAVLPLRHGSWAPSTTPADRAERKRAGLLGSHSLSSLVLLIGETGADEGRRRRRGNRAARRKRSLALA